MDEILNILRDIRPDINFEELKEYASSGLLDSLDIITLVTELDQKYSISIDGTDIIPKNFDSIEAIKNMLERYGVKFEL